MAPKSPSKLGTAAAAAAAAAAPVVLLPPPASPKASAASVKKGAPAAVAAPKSPSKLGAPAAAAPKSPSKLGAPAAAAAAPGWVAVFTTPPASPKAPAASVKKGALVAAPKSPKAAAAAVASHKSAAVAPISSKSAAVASNDHLILLPPALTAPAAAASSPKGTGWDAPSLWDQTDPRAVPLKASAGKAGKAGKAKSSSSSSSGAPAAASGWVAVFTPPASPKASAVAAPASPVVAPWVGQDNSKWNADDATHHVYELDWNISPAGKANSSSSQKSQGWGAPFPAFVVTPQQSPKSPAGKAKSSSSSSQSPIAVVDLGKSSKKHKHLHEKKTKKKQQNEDHMDIILRDIEKREKILEKYHYLMVMGKVNQAYRYITKHGMLDVVMDDEQFLHIDTPTGVALSKKFKKGKSSSSKKASTVAKAASDLEIVELTPSPKASSKKTSTHAKAASSPELEIVELSPSPQKKHPLSFGQQVAAKLLEQQSDKSEKVSAFKPAVFASLPGLKPTALQKHAGEIDKLHKSLGLSKGKGKDKGNVSPTFGPKSHGDWM